MIEVLGRNGNCPPKAKKLTLPGKSFRGTVPFSACMLSRESKENLDSPIE